MIRTPRLTFVSDGVAFATFAHRLESIGRCRRHADVRIASFCSGLSVKTSKCAKTNRRRDNSDGLHFQDVIRVCSRLVSALARNRTWSTTFAKSRANPAHSENILIGWSLSQPSTSPGSRTPSNGSEDRRAVHHTRKANAAPTNIACRHCVSDINRLGLVRVLRESFFVDDHSS